MRRWVYVLAVGCLSGGVALATSITDKTFVDKAAEGGMAEVQLSKLAMDKGDSSQVKQFARKMVEDHTKAGEELKQIAQQKSIPMPSAMDEQHKRVFDKLEKLSGPAFDKEYMRAMATDHDEAVKLFKSQAENGKDQELRVFAAKTLPVLEKHDDMAHMDQRHLHNE
jgi:putative membrane protein